jgi:hypothetical protein
MTFKLAAVRLPVAALAAALLIAAPVAPASAHGWHHGPGGLVFGLAAGAAALAVGAAAVATAPIAAVTAPPAYYAPPAPAYYAPPAYYAAPPAYYPPPAYGYPYYGVPR